MLFRDGHSARRNRNSHLNRALGIPGLGDPADPADPADPGGPDPTSTHTQPNTQSHTQATKTTPPPVHTTPPPTHTTNPNTSSQPNGQSASQPSNSPGFSYTPPIGGDPTSSSTIGGEVVPSPSTTLPPAPTGGGTLAKIGYAAGALIGLALLVAFIMFVLRKVRKRDDEALGDVFDRHSFVRDAPSLHDHSNENSHPSERGRPRPPTMIARHIGATNNNSSFNDYNGGGYGAPPVPALPDHGGYYGSNTGGYNNYDGPNGGYNDNNYEQYANSSNYHGYDNGYYGAQHGAQHGGYHDSPAQTPVDPYMDHTHSAQYLNHQVGPEYPALPAPAAVASPTAENGRSLTRQPSNRGPGVDYPNIAELGRGTSVTPYQAAQYAAIGKRLEDPMSSASGPSQAYAKLDRSRHPAYQEDAYGGI